MACCPGSLFPPPDPGVYLPAAYEAPAGFDRTQPPEVFGPLLWDQLHRRPAQVEFLWKESQWMQGFSGIIPCVKCREHWMGIIGSARRPDYTSQANYLRWTIAAHNDVNAILGKPLVDAAEAFVRYGGPAL